MGWSSGSRVMSDIISAVKETITDDGEAVDLLKCLIDIFEDNDCDTLYECVGEDANFDIAWAEMNPELEEEEDEFVESLEADWDDQSGGNF